MVAKIIKKFAGALAAVLILTGAAIGFGMLSTHQARACTGVGCSGGGGTITGGSCATQEAIDNNWTWFDTCYGTTWRQYELPEGVNTYYTNHSDNVSAVAIDVAGCRNVGATHYYLLALEQYRTQTLIGTGKQYGGKEVREVQPGGGRMPFNVTNGSSEWDTVASDFEDAVAHGGVDTDWPHTAWFCWNPGWACDEDDPSDLDCFCPAHPDDPRCITEDEPEEEHNDVDIDGKYWVDSTIEVTNNGRNGSPYVGNVSTETASSKRKVTIKVSADKDETVTIKFSHKMSYDDWLYNVGDSAVISATSAITTHGLNHIATSSDQWSTFSKSNYTITGTGGAPSRTGSVEGNSTNDGAIFSGQSDNTVTIDVNTITPGTTKKVCQYVSHGVDTALHGTDTDTWHPPVYGFFGLIRAGYWTHDGWTFSVSPSPAIHSDEVDLCAEIYRPKEPEGDVWTIAQGAPAASVMFAGENSQVGWNTSAVWKPARRVEEFKAVTFLVPSNVARTDAMFEKDFRSAVLVNPCAFARSRFNNTPVWCDVINGRESTSFSIEGEHTYSEAQQISVPDYTGYKYCTTLGYRWKGYYSITYDSDNWQPDGIEYWTNYGSACHTIAKKPSAAFWNGSVLTNGGIISSLSPRHDVGDAYYDNGNTPKVAAAATAQYGSWAEYLAVPNLSISGFVSGSAFEHGGSTGDICADSSTLTISNQNCTDLGRSGVSTSSTLRTRFDTYLRNQYNLTSISALPSNPIATNSADSGKPYIIFVDSDLTIDRDIILSSGPYANVYQIPQVIIFVSGNHTIKIDKDVTRIDAWIIADGSVLNTCAGRDGDRTIGTDSATHTTLRTDLTCDKQLTFNGPVLVSSAKLNRTYGSDPIVQEERQTPAEIFNLSAENYLWAFAQAGRYKSSYTEAYVRELAPRY